MLHWRLDGWPAGVPPLLRESVGQGLQFQGEGGVEQSMTDERSSRPESIAVSLQATDPDEVQRLAAIAALGMCQSLRAGVVTLSDPRI